MFFRVDFDKRIVEADILLKTAILDADYVMNGKFLVLPLKGNGKCKLEFSKYSSFVEAGLSTHDIRTQSDDYTSV
jgi:hypothetical protein